MANAKESDSVLVSKRMQSLAEMIDRELIDATGTRQAFVMVVFTEGRANYVSNGKKEDVRAELSMLVDHWREGLPDVPAHNVS